MKIYFVVTDQIPVLPFPSRLATEQFCHLRPDMRVVEFEIPTDLGPNNVKTNLMELHKLAGRSVTQEPPEQSIHTHRKFLEDIHKQMSEAKDGPDLPSAALARMAEGACQQRQCPGMMAYGLLSLK